MSIRVGVFGTKPRDGRRQLHLLDLQRTDEGTSREIIVGWHRYSRGELEPLREKGVRVRLRAVGVVSFTADVSPALVEAVFEELRVLGTVRNRPLRRTVAAG